METKIFFVGVNENSTTFLYTLNRGDQTTFFRRGKKISCPFYSKCIKSRNVINKKKLVFRFQLIQRIEQKIKFFESLEYKYDGIELKFCRNVSLLSSWEPKKAAHWPWFKVIKSFIFIFILCTIQSYEIKSPPRTIWWFRILGIFSVEI